MCNIYRNIKSSVRSEVLTAVLLKIKVFWDMTRCFWGVQVQVQGIECHLTMNIKVNDSPEYWELNTQ
jgi:hypothetical protein